MRQRQQGHALMVRHEGTEHGTIPPTRQSGRGIVDGLVEAVTAFSPVLTQLDEIDAGLLRGDKESH